MVTYKKNITKHLEIIRDNNGDKYFSWYHSDIKTYSDFKDIFVYRKRVLKHTITQKVFKFILKRMANYLAKRSNYRHSERDDVEQYYLEMEYKKEGYDNSVTKYQSLNKCYYCLRFGAFSFYGYSEYETYLEFIRRIIISPAAFPYC